MKTPRQTARPKPWYLLTGFILGAILGLVYAWVISPVEYVDTPPSALRPDAKDQYRVLIALSYGVTGDLPRAKARLAVLDSNGKMVNGEAVDPLPTSAQWLAAQAQRALADGRPQTEVQALGLLAAALGEKPTPLPSLTPTASPTPRASPTFTPPTPTPEASQTQPLPTSSESPSQTQPPPSPSLEPGQTPQPSSSQTPVVQAQPSDTPTATSPATASPTGAVTIPIEEEVQLHDATPTLLPNPDRTPLPAYEIQSRKLICDPGLDKSQIQIQVKDAAGKGVSGVKALIDWEGGQDSFTTGLKPELGRGYADFTMTPGLVYTLRLTESGQPLTGLKAEECKTSRGEKYWGTWLLTFSQVD
jgi:hypothetical protein